VLVSVLVASTGVASVFSERFAIAVGVMAAVIMAIWAGPDHPSRRPPDAVGDRPVATGTRRCRHRLRLEVTASPGPPAGTAAGGQEWIVADLTCVVIEDR
jgi:hypothetical protein